MENIIQKDKVSKKMLADPSVSETVKDIIRQIDQQKQVLTEEINKIFENQLYEIKDLKIEVSNSLRLFEVFIPIQKLSLSVYHFSNFEDLGYKFGRMEITADQKELVLIFFLNEGLI